MNLSIAILAVSFLPFFEARNQVANFVFNPPPEGKTVKPVLPNLTVTEKCPGCDGKGEIVLEEPDYGQAKGRLGAAKKTRKQCPLCNGKGKIQSFMNPSELALQVASDRAAFAAEHQGRGEIAVGDAFVPNAKYPPEASGRGVRTPMQEVQLDGARTMQEVQGKRIGKMH